RAAAQRVEDRRAQATHAIRQPTADEHAGHAEREQKGRPLTRGRRSIGRREPAQRERRGEERGEPRAEDEELPRVSDVRDDRADQRRGPKPATTRSAEAVTTSCAASAKPRFASAVRTAPVAMTRDGLIRSVSGRTTSTAAA